MDFEFSHAKLSLRERVFAMETLFFLNLMRQLIVRELAALDLLYFAVD